MGKYKKLVAAVVGLGALLVTEFVGWKLPFAPEAVTQVLISLLTAFGVFKVTNA